MRPSILRCRRACCIRTTNITEWSLRPFRSISSCPLAWQRRSLEKTRSNGQSFAKEKGRTDKSRPRRSCRTYEDIPLMTKDAQQPIYDYRYYDHLLLTDAWRVPVLYGKLPGAPDATATPHEKGMHALTMLFLFKPHRDDLMDFVLGTNMQEGLSLEDAWQKIYDMFCEWRKLEIDAVAARCGRAKTPSDLAQPSFGTNEWWACVIAEKLKNYEVAVRRHKAAADSAPKNLSSPLSICQRAATRRWRRGCGHVCEQRV